jgi:hypothetical protein
MTFTPGDLAVYLDTTMDDGQTARAQMLIDDAIAQALAVVTVVTIPVDGPTEDNLPVGWESVLRPAVARIYLNPAGVTSQAAGPYSEGRTANTGAMLSKSERATLRRLAGGGGAFSIDGLPDEYCPDVAPWDVGAPIGLIDDGA